MLQSPLKREGTRRLLAGGKQASGPGRGTIVATFDAKFHGCVSVQQPGGMDVCMDAVSRIHALKVCETDESTAQGVRMRLSCRRSVSPLGFTILFVFLSLRSLVLSSCFCFSLSRLSIPSFLHVCQRMHSRLIPLFLSLVADLHLFVSLVPSSIAASLSLGH